MKDIDKETFETSDYFAKHLFGDVLIDNKDLLNLLPKGDIAKNDKRFELAIQELKKYLDERDPNDTEEQFANDVYRIVKTAFMTSF